MNYGMSPNFLTFVGRETDRHQSKYRHCGETLSRVQQFWINFANNFTACFIWFLESLEQF